LLIIYELVNLQSHTFHPSNMSQSKLRSFIGISITILCLIAVPLQTHAADKSKTKAAHSAKERLVLMPIRVPEEDKNLTGAMETALVKGLQQKYDVFSGERVAQKAHEIFMKESRNTAHTECDETRCMQNIAEAFQAELIATANVTKKSDGYFIALSIQNIFDNNVVQSESVPCKGCDSYAVVEKLKELVGEPAQPLLVKEVAHVDKVQHNERPQKQKANVEIYSGKVFQDCADCPEMVEIPAGSFEMGSNNDFSLTIKAWNKDELIAIALAEKQGIDYAAARSRGYSATEMLPSLLERFPESSFKPAHRVTINRPFAMGKTEVTQAQWHAVMVNNPSTFKSCGNRCPVEGVSWNDIQLFIQKLNVMTGKQYRLPSEAEWEYACHAGKSEKYCGSDNADSVAWYAGNSDKTIHKVATKQPNAWGLYDMSGNVWEWVADNYHENFYGAPYDGSAWQGNAAMNVIRGGAYINVPQIERSVGRFRNEPANRLTTIGFRLARALP